MKIVLVDNIQFTDGMFDHPTNSLGLQPQRVSLGLMTIGAMLEQTGHDIECIDFGYLADKDELVDCNHHNLYVVLARHLKDRNADILGFTSRSDSYPIMLRVAESYRQIDPNTPIVFGGPQATVTNLDTLHAFSCVDVIVRNEGEQTIVELTEALQHGLPLSEIAGITYRDRETIHRTPDRPLILNLDDMPLPAFHLYPLEEMVHRGLRLPLEAGRGCPFACVFCTSNTFFHRRYRLKSGERIIEEVRFLKERYGTRKVEFVHDSLTVNRVKALQICEALLSADLGVTWVCSTRTDCVDRELLEKMAAAGCKSIYFGVETGSKRMQGIITKRLNLDTVDMANTECTRLGIKRTTSFIVGFPDETEDDLEQTLEHVVKYKLKGALTQVHMLAPGRGTPLFAEYSHRLAFDGYFSDQTTTTLADMDGMYELLHRHPSLFSYCYYYEPKHVDRETYKELDIFGYSIARYPFTILALLKSSRIKGILDLYQQVKHMVKMKYGSAALRQKNMLLDDMPIVDVYQVALRDVCQLLTSDSASLSKVFECESSARHEVLFQAPRLS